MNYIISIINPDSLSILMDLCNQLDLPLSITMAGRGTAVQSMLDLLGIESNERRIVFTVAYEEKTKKLFKKKKKQKPNCYTVYSTPREKGSMATGSQAAKRPCAVTLRVRRRAPKLLFPPRFREAPNNSAFRIKKPPAHANHRMSRLSFIPNRVRMPPRPPRRA